METIWKDLWHGARLLTRSPGVSVVSVLALGLGIGLSTTMFSIVYGVVLRGLPYPGSNRIMTVGQQNLPADQDYVGITIHDYKDYAAQQRAFEDLAAYSFVNASVSGTERAEQFSGAYLTANTFTLLGVQPLLGRLFTPADEGRAAERVVLISETMWRDRYASARTAIGKSIRVNGRPVTIIGVMPDDFRFPNNQQLWLPIDLDPLALERGAGYTLDVIGRLREGTSRTDALDNLTAIAERMERENPATNTNVRPTVDPFTTVNIGHDAVGMLYTMLGAVFFVLLIACTNVANLLFSRAIVRSKEVGIRTALGASRARIVMQLLTEALVLCSLGALLGTLLSFAGIAVFNASLEPSFIPFFVSIKVDGAAMQFVFALTIITTLVAAAIPALKSSRGDVSGLLKDESRGASSFRMGRLSRALVVFEIALSCGLLVAAGLTTRSIIKLRNVDLGFDESNLFTGILSLSESSYPDSTMPLFYQQLSERLAVVPGLEVGALATSLPGMGGLSEHIALEGTSYQRQQDQPIATHIGITPDYPATLGLSLLEGRGFTGADRAGTQPVAIVNQSFERRHFPGSSALGRRFRIGSDNEASSWLTIVGVLPDVRYDELADGNDPAEAFFTPLAQQPQSGFFIIGRTRNASVDVTNDVRAAVAAIDRDLPLTWTRSLRRAVEVDTWFFDVFGGVFVVFGGVALVLAAVGLYAVMAFSVSQRTREVGIRMAIGASSSDVRIMILRQGVLQVAIGMFFGLLMAFGVSRLLQVILFDVDPRDPIVFITVIALLTTTAVLACIVPARRATRIHPLDALRHD